MGFPVETVDGEIVTIAEKTAEGHLVAEDGSVYKPNSIDALKVELVEAVEAVEEAVAEIGDVVDVASEAISELLGSDQPETEVEADGNEVAEAPEAA